jgi:hypothetical protein
LILAAFAHLNQSSNQQASKQASNLINAQTFRLTFVERRSGSFEHASLRSRVSSRRIYFENGSESTALAIEWSNRVDFNNATKHRRLLAWASFLLSMVTNSLVLQTLECFSQDNESLSGGIQSGEGMKKNDMMVSHETLMTNETSSLSSLSRFDYSDIIDTSSSSRQPDHEVGITGTEALLIYGGSQGRDLLNESSEIVDNMEETEDDCDSSKAEEDEEIHKEPKQKWRALGSFAFAVGALKMVQKAMNDDDDQDLGMNQQANAQGPGQPDVSQIQADPGTSNVAMPQGDVTQVASQSVQQASNFASTTSTQAQ